MRKVLCILIIALLSVASVSAQPPFHCGMTTPMEVAYPKVDNMGFTPRLVEGSQMQFDCITLRDSDFASRRFQDVIAATNYWYTLLGQEWGVTFTPLATPTGK